MKPAADIKTCECVSLKKIKVMGQRSRSYLQVSECCAGEGIHFEDVLFSAEWSRCWETFS